VHLNCTVHWAQSTPSQASALSTQCTTNLEHSHELSTQCRLTWQALALSATDLLGIEVQVRASCVVLVYMYMCLYICESICIFAEIRHAFTGVVEHHACASVYVRQMLWTSVYTFAPRSLQDVHMRYIYTCIYAYMYVYIYMYIYICMHVYICICMYVYTCICVYVWMCIYVYVYVYVCIYIYICICMCIYIYIYIYITCIFSLFHLALGNEDGGVRLV